MAILTLDITHKWELHHVDINIVFFNGTLQEEVYMVQLSDFISSNKTIVYKLHKTLYRVKQPPRKWYEKLHKLYFTLIFVQHQCNVLHARTEHIELDIRFVRERVSFKKLVIQHVPDCLQIADTLTKHFGSATFRDLRVKLKVGLQPPDA
ncbi:uncharacterized protein LOC131662096 [Vicia villosa]|uniref:uncharacterized protein LOC131662096 n=1 Tax=Vicia villosa TaxID=3911 RepID=UPI00273BD589|nr:uncharacterized protein LOC131662096 [Vicia villosa]